MQFGHEHSQIYNKSVYQTEFNYAPEKTIANDLKNYSPILLDQIGCKVFELTVEFHPNQIRRDEAWETIKFREELIVNQLKTNPNVEFILAGIEIHTGKKKAKKTLADGEVFDNEDEELEEEKDKFLYIVTSEMEENNSFIYEELLYELFVKYDHNLNIIKVNERNVSVDIIYSRIFKHTNLLLKASKISLDYNIFAQKMKHEKGFAKSIYNLLINAYGDYILKSPYFKPNTLQGYPHIHFAICVKNECLNFKTCSDIERFIKAQSNLPFYDIKATRISETGTKSTDGKRGKKSKPYNTEMDGPIFSYVMKNDRYYKTLQNLNKGDNFIKAITLFNLKQNQHVQRFFTFFTNFDISINNVNKRILTENELLLMYTKFEHRVSYHGDLTTVPLTNFIMTSSNNSRSRQVKEMTLFMEKNNFAVSFDGAIYSKVKGSINTWQSSKIIKTAEDLFYSARIINVNDDILTDNFKKEFIETCKNINQNDYPKVFVDSLSVEFYDFYFYLPSFAIIKKDNTPNQHYACVSYFPEICFSDLDKIKKLEFVPKNYIKILSNSDYIYDNKPNGVYGKKLVKDLWNYICGFKPDKAPSPNFVGTQNSCKSTTLDVLNNVFPTNTFLELNDNSDRFIFQDLASTASIRRIYSDEAKDGKATVIDTTTMLKLGTFGSYLSASSRGKGDKKVYNSFTVALAGHTSERLRDPKVNYLLTNDEYKRYLPFHNGKYQELNNYKFEEEQTEYPTLYKNSLIEQYKESLKNLKLYKEIEYINGFTALVYRSHKTICDDPNLSVHEKNIELNRDLDQGLNTRFNIYCFNELKERDANGRQRCFEESPLVLLYLAVVNNNYDFNYADNIKDVRVLIDNYLKSKEDNNSFKKSTNLNFSHDGEYVRYKIRFDVPLPPKYSNLF